MAHSFASCIALFSAGVVTTAAGRDISLQDIRLLDREVVQITNNDPDAVTHCMQALQKVVPVFLPTYDVSLIRSNRWRLLIDQSLQFEQSHHSYWMWDVIVSSETGNEKQNAINSLIMHCGRKLCEINAYQLDEATIFPNWDAIPTSMSHALEVACLCYMFSSVTTEWEAYQRIEDRIAQILADADLLEQQALRIRAIRLLSALPVVRTDAVSDRIRCRRIGQLAMALAHENLGDSCIAAIFYLANISKHCKIEATQIQTADESVFASYHVGSFDASGSFHEAPHVSKKDMLSAHYAETAQVVQSFVLEKASEIAEQFPYPVLEGFVRDVVHHLGISERDVFLQILDSFDTRMSWKRGLLREYLQRKAIRDNRPELLPVSEQEATEEWLEPYPTIDGIKTDLNRYHLLAGVFVQAICSKADSPTITNRLSYLLFKPEGVSSKTPLVLFIPGSGELGPDLSRQFHQRTIFNIVTSSEFQKRHPCYLLVIAPPEEAPDLCGRLSDWTPGPYQRLYLDALSAIIRHCRAPEVDMNRIYATGLSSGGRAVYGLSFVAPKLFAASIPVSSGVFSPEDVRSGRPGNWYHLYNEGDYRRNPESISRLNAFSERVRTLGGDFRIGVYPIEGHNAWDNAWRETSVWDWLFSKTLNEQPSQNENPNNRKGVMLPIRLCSASKPGIDDRRSPDRAADGLEGTAYISLAPMTSGDWWKCEFSMPFKGKLRVLTGLQDGTGKLSRGHVEVSSDGRLWVRTASFSTKTGEAVFSLQSPVLYLRVLPEPRRPEPLILREIKPE